MAGGGLGSVGGLRSMPPVGLTPGFGNPPNFNSMQHIKSKGFSGMSQTRQQVAEYDVEFPPSNDEQGNVIKMEREATTTLKINQKLLQREQQKLQPSQPKTGDNFGTTCVVVGDVSLFPSLV
eukprot:1394919-Amorphochlora_amoeboformis.AAC.1